MNEKYNVKLHYRAAVPRNQQLLDAVLYSSGGGGGGSSTGRDGDSYWKLITSDENGKILDEPYLVCEYSVASKKDIVAYKIGQDKNGFPIASKVDLGGIIVGDGLSIDEKGVLSIDGTSGAGSGTLTGISVSGTGNVITGVTLSSDKKTLTFTKGDFIAKSTYDSHANSTTIHVNQTEKNQWNNAYSRAHDHSNKSYLDNINQNLSTSSNTTFNNITANNTIFSAGSITTNSYIRAANDVVAYSTGMNNTPFVYWRPNCDSNGNLSWSNSQSTTTPSTVNVKGTNGTNGQGTTYQWSGTQLRLGTINSAGTTSWGNYVNLQGATGPAGGGLSIPYSSSYSGNWLTNPTVNASFGFNTTNSTIYMMNYNYGGAVNIGTSGISRIWVHGDGRVRIGNQSNINGSLSCQFSGGNSLNGLRDGSINHLYFNYVSGSTYVKVTNTGSIEHTGSIGKPSDMKIKDIVKPLENTLENVKNMDVFYYTYKNDENQKVQIGLSANQFEEKYPELVSKNEEGILSLDYSNVSAILLQSVKELTKRVEELEAKLEEKR